MRKLTIFFIATLLIFFNFNIKSVNADGWGTNVGAELMGQAWQLMQDQIKGMTLSSLKQQGINALMRKLSAEANSHLIGDHNKYLSHDLNEDVNVFMEDYYKTIADRDGKNSDKYIEEARITTQNAIKKDLSSAVEGATIGDSFISGVVDVKENLFNEKVGGGIALVPVMLEDNNNKYGRFIKESTKINNTKELMKEARKTEAMGNGYTGDEKFSGSVYAEMMKRGATANQDLLVNATNMSELSGLLNMEIDLLSESEYEEPDTGDMAKDLLKKLGKGAAVGLLTGGAVPGLDQYIGFNL